MSQTLKYIIWAIIILNVLLIWSWTLFGNSGVSKDEAQTLFAKGDYANFVDQTSDDIQKYDDIVYRRWLAYLKLWEFDKSLQSFLTSYKVLKSTVNVGMMKSLWLFLKQDYDSVEATIKPIRSPNFFEMSAIHLLWGINYYYMWNLWAASSWITDSLAWDPISPIAYHYLGRIALDQQKRELAKTQFIRAADQGYATRTQDLFLAQAHVELDEDQEAGFILEDFPRDQIEKLPDPAVYYLTQAKVASGKEQRDTALAFYNKVLEADPSNQSLYTLVGKLYLDQWDSKKAWEIFQQWYDYDQTNTNTLVDQYVAFVSSDLDDPKFKKDLFSKILLESGTKQAKYDYAAKTMYDNKLLTEAQLAVDRLLTINPNHGWGKGVKRDIYAQKILAWLRNKENVEGLFDQTLRDFPEDQYILTIKTIMQANEWNTNIAWGTYNTIWETVNGYNFSEVLWSQISYAFLEGRWGIEELISRFVARKQEEITQQIDDHALQEPRIDEIDLERSEEETIEQFDARIQTAFVAANTAREKQRPVIDDNMFKKMTLLLKRLNSWYIDNQRDYSSQAELVELDFRFAEDDFIKSQAHEILGSPYKRLVPFYDHVDTLFIKDA